MRRIPISIIHILGFSLLIVICSLTFIKTAVVGTDGGVAKVLSLLSYRHKAVVSCQAEAISQLIHRPNDKSAGFTCDLKQCVITIYSNPEHKILKSFKAQDNWGIAVIDIKDFFYDPQREIVSYSTQSNLSSRIVMNFEGELLQSIDESPGKDRQLSLLGYQPDTGMLVYKDLKSNDWYFYRVDSIYLARRRCR
jgi:hypothetical protein